MLLEKDLVTKRVPFSGEFHTFRRWDSISNIMQKSSIDHLVWNGAETPSVSVAADGIFTLDHIPLVVDTSISTIRRTTKITNMKLNPTLKYNENGVTSEPK